MNHSGVFFSVNVIAQKQQSVIYFLFITLVAVGRPNKISSVLGLNVERGIFLSERHCIFAIFKTVRFAAVNTITVFLNFKSRKFLSGHNYNYVNKFAMKLA